jgi:hypothetical protein
MFDWFRKPNYANVVPIFPDQVPFIEEPAPEKDPTTYYSIGHTDDNRVTLRMGYTTLTMNYDGVQNLIDQLALYQKQLKQKEEDA